jgi:hypothetical protein
MVSLQAFTAFPDLVTTYDIQDYRSINYYNKAPKNTILSMLYSPDYSYYMSLVSTAELEGIFADEQALLTLFVIKDKDIPDRLKRIIINADKNTALAIINYNTLPIAVNQHSLKSAPCYYMNTRNNKDRLFISNNKDGTLINEYSKIVDCALLGNGMVYVVDKILIPEYICN